MSCFKFFSSFLFFCLMLFTAWTKSAFPQNSFSELEASEIYSAELNIVNGSKWYYGNKYKGNPFLYDNGFTEGNVLFRGEIFSNLTLAFELFLNELILIKKVDNENKELILNEKFVESFTLKNSGNKDEYTFVRKKLPGVEGIKYYHVVYNGATSCFIYHKKNINNRIAGDYLGEYLYQPVIYIKKGDEFRDCKNKRSFLRLLEDQKELLRKYIRKNNLSVDGKNPQHIALILEYYDSLTH
jgi:hypothetical protein